MTDFADECGGFVRFRKYGRYQKHRRKHGKDRGEGRSLGHCERVVLKGTPERDPKV